MRNALIAGVVGFVVGLAALRLLLVPRFQKLAVDVPNERSLHERLVPRTGGLAILAGTSAGLLSCPERTTGVLWGLALCLGAASFVDDRRGLPIGLRLLAQVGLAVLAITFIGGARPFWWIAFAVLTTVWLTNLYNFMDGADGLAGGMGLFGFGAYAIAAMARGDMALATLCLSVAAGCAAFLTCNFPPARIFMGDAGSTSLGFTAAVVGLYGQAVGLWPLWFPALVFLPFIADATVTLGRRVLRGDRFWKAHREHYYQRLIRSGWGHARMAKVAYWLMVAVGSSAVLALVLEPFVPWQLMLAVWAVVFAGLMLAVDARWNRHHASPSHGTKAAANAHSSRE